MARSQPMRIRPTSSPTAAQSFCRPRTYAITQQSKASGTGGPPQIRDIGGRSQGDDEHARERTRCVTERAQESTQASAPLSGSPPNRKIPRGETAPGRLGREDARNFRDRMQRGLGRKSEPFSRIYSEVLVDFPVVRVDYVLFFLRLTGRAIRLATARRGPAPAARAGAL